MKKVVIIYGLPGSGKSFFASRLAEAIEAEYLSTDVIRKDIIRQRTYSDQEKNAVYLEMTMLMQRLLNHDKSIVIDGTFYKQELRNMVEKEALDLKAAVYYIKITADEGVIRERMTEKRPYSEADFKVYLALKRKFEGMTQDHLVLDSVKCSVDEMMRLALKYLDE